MQDTNGQPISLGSGFFVADGVIATNLHVVRGASTGQVKLIGQARTYSIVGLVGVDVDADLVLLRVSAKAPALQLEKGDDLAVGDAVYAIGNPEGLEGTFSQGIVSGIRSVATDKLLQITAPISPGSSGGPIINGRGHVVGVAVATIAEGQNLNFAIPSSYLAALLKHMGEPRALSSEKQLQGNAGSFAQVSGTNNTDGVTGAELRWDDSKYIYGTPNDEKLAKARMRHFSFTFQNQLQSAVTDIHFVVVLFGSDGKAADSFEAWTCPGMTILPMLAKREVAAYWSPPDLPGPTCARMWMSLESSQYEIRVLDFKLAK
jgi:hypothetical protein